MKKLIIIFIVITLAFSSVSFAESGDDLIIGKWSCNFDITQLAEVVQKVYDFSLIVYDLYLFDNGSAYLTNVTIPKKTGKPDFSYGALSGIWIGSRDDMSIKIGDNIYKAKISEDGYLLLYLTKALPMAFVRVDTTDKMIELGVQ